MNIYFDTSALAKLMLRESGSEQAERLWAQADAVASSRVTQVETRSSLARAERAGHLGHRSAQAAYRQLRLLLDRLDLVEVRAPVASAAGDLAQLHALGALDAIHLASAFVLARADPDVVLGTWDLRLRRAAAESGLAVAPAYDG